MRIDTVNFGPVEVREEEVFAFPEGIYGYRQCTQWIFVEIPENRGVVWLQSTEQPDVAIPLTDPRRFEPGYQLRASLWEVEPLQLDDLSAAKVLAVIGHDGEGFCLNLKAPIVVNLSRQRGRQIIANGRPPLRRSIVSKGAAQRNCA